MHYVNLMNSTTLLDKTTNNHNDNTHTLTEEIKKYAQKKREPLPLSIAIWECICATRLKGFDIDWSEGWYLCDVYANTRTF